MECNDDGGSDSISLPRRRTGDGTLQKPADGHSKTLDLRRCERDERPFRPGIGRERQTDDVLTKELSASRTR